MQADDVCSGVTLGSTSNFWPMKIQVSYDHSSEISMRVVSDQ